MSYWVYENWVAERKAVIHEGACGFCNNGTGTGRNTRGDRNGRWHGPFNSVDDADVAAQATGRPVRPHGCVASVNLSTLRTPAEPAFATSVANPLPKPTESLPAGVRELEQFGFKPAGVWVLDENAKAGVRCLLKAHRSDRAVYAFVVNERPEYVGICDSSRTTLGDRMARYQNVVGAGTNARIVALIRTSLLSGAEVLIYAMIPTAGPSHLTLEVDYVKGLEFPLIQRLNPSWNRHR